MESYTRRYALGASTAAGVVALVVYWHTSHRTITWWDSAPYSLAANTLGVVAAPGSLLLTLLGWIVTRLPLGISPAFSLNLLAGLLGATTVALTANLAFGLCASPVDNRTSRVFSLVAAATTAGTLPLAFGPTHWEYAVKFTPYVLTATFTAAILYVLLRWWQVAADRLGSGWLLAAALLIGLDFSVHRTNALLFPGILCWVLIRRPGIIKSLRAWVAGVGGLTAGLSLQLLLMPMAARDPPLNIGMPSSWSRLWDYVSLKPIGGGFLLNLYPRRSGFLDHQLRDVMEALGSSFAATDGSMFLLGALPLALGAYGVYFLWRKDARLAAALCVLLVTTVLMTVAYFNIPESYFRPLHRHYLPCLVIFASLSATGAGAVTERLCRHRGRRGTVLGAAAIVLIAAVGIGRVADNYGTQDRSHSYFAYDFADNLLSYLPPDTILLTNGDNDTFPLWYLQFVKGVRPDVSVVNIPLTNASWYIENVLSGPGGIPFSRPPAEMTGLLPVVWEERLVELPGPPAGETTTPADSVRLTVTPTAGQYLLVQDQVVLDMLRANRWRRPVMIATTVSPSSLPWLRDRLRLEGLAYRLVPTKDPEPAIATVQSNLLEHYRYRGYADPRVDIDETSGMMAQNYVAAFIALAGALRESESSEDCEEIIGNMEAVFPLERIHASEQLIAVISQACREQ